MISDLPDTTGLTFNCVTLLISSITSRLWGFGVATVSHPSWTAVGSTRCFMAKDRGMVVVTNLRSSLSGSTFLNGMPHSAASAWYIVSSSSSLAGSSFRMSFKKEIVSTIVVGLVILEEEPPDASLIICSFSSFF